jgi:hypothetical protein
MSRHKRLTARNKPLPDLDVRQLIEDLEWADRRVQDSPFRAVQRDEPFSAVDIAFRVSRATYAEACSEDRLRTAFEVFHWLQAQDTPVWIGGEWTVDFAMGRVLGEHRRIALFTPLENLDALHAAILSAFPEADRVLVAPLDGLGRRTVPLSGIELFLIAIKPTHDPALVSFWDGAFCSVSRDQFADRSGEIVWNAYRARLRMASIEVYYLHLLNTMTRVAPGDWPRGCADLRAIAPLVNRGRLEQVRESWSVLNAPVL